MFWRNVISLVMIFGLFQDLSAIKVLKNVLRVNEPDGLVGGAKLIDQKTFEKDMDGVTICFRFNLESLVTSTKDLSSRILTIGMFVA